MIHDESAIQQGIVTWCRLYGRALHPDVEITWHTPNGGRRNVREAARLRDEGVLPGVPDLFVPVASNGYHGLFLEVKTESGKLTTAQKSVIEKLIAGGYRVEVVRSVRDGIDVIVDYVRDKHIKATP